MSNIIYLKIVGERQGVISEGCGSESSVGNRYQAGHEDEIFVFSLQALVSSAVAGVNHQGIRFCKPIDKSSPLFTQAINNNERCTLDFTFYRINRWGRWEKYYQIEVRGASVTAWWMQTRLDGIAEELITINYDYICSKHLIANTEYNALLTPENDNQLFPATLPAVKKPAPPIKKREITLTIGVFFDGTGNNLLNTNLRMQKCNPESYGLDARALTEFSQRCMKKEGFDGIEVGSYLNYYTNIRWLYDLYHVERIPEEINDDVQRKFYIEGIGTENNKADSLLGLGLGNNDTGVIAKTDKAIALICQLLNNFINEIDVKNSILKHLQFDVFGFSRGAAAARHFTNRVFERDPALVNGIRQVFANSAYSGKPAGEVRFLGIFDTVTAVGGVMDGFDPHDSNNLQVKLALPPGVAKHVFHLTAKHECRYNFCLNSVKEQWPEMSLPGAHADIGGGYNPLEEEYLFLTRPAMQTVSSDIPVQSTDVYRRTVREAERLHTHPVLAPVLPSGILKIESDIDECIPSDQYHNRKKRVAAAATFRRTVSNDWSKVTLRVMYEVAKEAGIIFAEIDSKNKELAFNPELNTLSERVILFAKKSLLSGHQENMLFDRDELKIIGKYIHCSANWNAVNYNIKSPVISEVAIFDSFSFVNRPDDNWIRTIYNMSGEKLK
ncbi:type VI secretion system tube protein Hcp [Salmonella enterica subsp. houtenae]|uniref:Type VI secretion system tube protein Hcp n=2 Tax=Salmonella houtenae TaxID=59205 RepID=A0A5Y6M5S9_SALHO|nr:type VI secretion system tube protein Hcp [Salmonella enterica subsp. enterica]EAW0937519.1 type VI secretion system tube protein Hcp [Salmonella enterica]EBF8287341.1 type VI secretion system tube protein Hcp [Salmonella enterica subsp. houtenae]EBQ5981684.1 type VI secretion system tube protein Hcp [Salmonella enterica subsp. houtenae serovar Houten]EDS4966678.1 type VI secretion system tube protein Hcp [Salmonella enterica subsp. enterica serovar O rough]EHA4051567.1 type VI secretion sy